MTPERGAKLAANLLILAFKDITLDDGSISVALEPHSVRLGPSEQRYLLRLASLTAIKKAARKLVPFLDFSAAPGILKKPARGTPGHSSW